MDDIKNNINENCVLKKCLLQKIKENKSRIFELLYQCEKQEFRTNVL